MRTTGRVEHRFKHAVDDLGGAMAFPVNLIAINAECVHAAAVADNGFHQLCVRPSCISLRS